MLLRALAVGLSIHMTWGLRVGEHHDHVCRNVVVVGAELIKSTLRAGGAFFIQLENVRGLVPAAFGVKQEPIASANHKAQIDRIGGELFFDQVGSFDPQREGVSGSPIWKNHDSPFVRISGWGGPQFSQTRFRFFGGNFFDGVRWSKEPHERLYIIRRCFAGIGYYKAQGEDRACVVYDQGSGKVHTSFYPGSLTQFSARPRIGDLVMHSAQYARIDYDISEYQQDAGHLYRFLYVVPGAIAFAFATAMVAYGLYCSPTWLGVPLILLASVPIYAVLWCFGWL